MQSIVQPISESVGQLDSAPSSPDSVVSHQEEVNAFMLFGAPIGVCPQLACSVYIPVVPVDLRLRCGKVGCGVIIQCCSLFTCVGSRGP